MTNLASTISKTVTLPLRRFFNERFGTVDSRLVELQDRLADARVELQRAHQQIDARADELRHLLGVEMRLANDTATLFGAAFNELQGALDALRQDVLSPDSPPLKHSARTIADIDARIADLLNHAFGYEGFAAQAGLWFNPPVWPLHAPGEVRIGGVNERIGEVPYVFRAMALAEPGSTVLDVGGNESTVGLSLASLGYQVTVVDPRPSPLDHPRLTHVVSQVEEWQTDQRFDVAIALSTIEHLGVGAYGQPRREDADIEAMHRVRHITRDGGLLVLTTPYGAPTVNEHQRVYDKARLDTLLEGWATEDVSVLRKLDETHWVVDDHEPASDEMAVIMVTARRSH